MLEAGRLQRIFHDFRHLDDALFEATWLRLVLLARCIPKESRLALRIRDVLWLRGSDLGIHEFF